MLGYFENKVSLSVG